MGKTIVQKILARACNKDSVEVGSVVEPAVDLAMSHENAALVINQFQEIYQGTGTDPRVWDPDKIAIIFDHIWYGPNVFGIVTSDKPRDKVPSFRHYQNRLDCAIFALTILKMQWTILKVEI